MLLIDSMTKYHHNLYMSEERVVKVVSHINFVTYKPSEIIDFPEKPPTEAETETCPICNEVVPKGKLKEHLAQCIPDDM